MVTPNRHLLKVLDKKLRKLASSSSPMLENHLEHETKSDSRADEHRASDEALSNAGRSPGALGSPIGGNLISLDDMKGEASIFAGEPSPKDPYGDRIREAVKVKLQEFSAEESKNVEDVIKDQTNSDTRYT